MHVRSSLLSFLLDIDPLRCVNPQDTDCSDQLPMCLARRFSRFAQLVMPVERDSDRQESDVQILMRSGKMTDCGKTMLKVYRARPNTFSYPAKSFERFDRVILHPSRVDSLLVSRVRLCSSCTRSFFVPLTVQSRCFGKRPSIQLILPSASTVRVISSET